jgi:hypothetical protein
MKGMISLLVFAAFFAAIVATPVIAQDAAPVVTSPQQIESLLQTLQKENVLLQEKVRMLESAPHVDSDTLSRKTYQRLQDIAGAFPALSAFSMASTLATNCREVAR